MAKERRKLRQAQTSQLVDSIVTQRPTPVVSWEDPLAPAGERKIAAEELPAILANGWHGLGTGMETKGGIENLVVRHYFEQVDAKNNEQAYPCIASNENCCKPFSSNRGEMGSG